MEGLCGEGQEKQGEGRAWIRRPLLSRSLDQERPLLIRSPSASSQSGWIGHPVGVASRVGSHVVQGPRSGSTLLCDPRETSQPLCACFPSVTEV